MHKIKKSYSFFLPLNNYWITIFFKIKNKQLFHNYSRNDGGNIFKIVLVRLVKDWNSL